jgi:hypothetical protein
VPAVPLPGHIELDQQRRRPGDVAQDVVDAVGPEDRADHGRIERVERGGTKDEIASVRGHRPDDLATDVLTDHPVCDQDVVARHELRDRALVDRGQIQAGCPALERVVQVARPFAGERPADQPEQFLRLAVVEDEVVALDEGHESGGDEAWHGEDVRAAR